MGVGWKESGFPNQMVSPVCCSQSHSFDCHVVSRIIREVKQCRIKVPLHSLVVQKIVHIKLGISGEQNVVHDLVCCVKAVSEHGYSSFDKSVFSCRAIV